MDELLRDHPGKVIGLIIAVIAAVVATFWKIGWLNIPKSKEPEWDGHDRRQCGQHPYLQDKVCSLYKKLDDLDEKLDALSNKMHIILGALEQRWGKRISRDE